MSHLQYYRQPGYGEWAYDKFAYNQAVRVGDSVHCSGQGETLVRSRRLASYAPLPAVYLDSLHLCTILRRLAADRTVQA